MSAVEEIGAAERSTGLPTVNDRAQQLQQQKRATAASQRAEEAQQEQRPQGAETAKAISASKTSVSTVEVPKKGISFRSNFDGQRLMTEVIDTKTDQAIVRIPYGSATEAVEESLKETEVDEVV